MRSCDCDDYWHLASYGGMLLLLWLLVFGVVSLEEEKAIRDAQRDLLVQMTTTVEKIRKMEAQLADVQVLLEESQPE
jgi:hypothetical protein